MTQADVADEADGGGGGESPGLGLVWKLKPVKMQSKADEANKQME